MKFTIYDLRHRLWSRARDLSSLRFEDAVRNSNLLWLLLVVPPALAVFFWWAMRTRQKLLAQFIEARLFVAVDGRSSAGAAEIAFWNFNAGRGVIGSSRWPGRNADLICRRSSSVAWTSLWRWTPPRACWRPTSRRTGCARQTRRAGIDGKRLDGPDGLVAFAGDAFLECPLTVTTRRFNSACRHWT